MAHEEFSREEIPSDGVGIGGDDDCEHATYQRFGSDGGGNIYFQCTDCSHVILNYDSTDTNAGSDRDRTAPKLTPETSDGPKHDPLMKGLSFGSEDSDGSRQSSGGPDSGFLGRIKSDFQRLFGKDR
ncbi:hypothetical protein [Halovenus sp. HT40]|uniref:hypothetical protein n=1 Tax=Halovenus sp. HT40 TaxID=3126691 RepID=UPI00300F16D4